MREVLEATRGLTSGWWSASDGLASRFRADHRMECVMPGATPDRIVLFSDPDTLRDRRRTSWAARHAIAACEDHNIAVVLWGNETRLEMELIQSDLNLNHPFISENGGGLFIPHGYFGLFECRLQEPPTAATGSSVVHRRFSSGHPPLIMPRK